MKVLFVFAFITVFLTNASYVSAQNSVEFDDSPPDSSVKIVFIHHSTGGNWLADPENNELGGGLGQALLENNYYVSATNYGWGPDSIGDATDIPNWLDWFRGDRSTVYLDALYNENGQNFGDFGAWPRLIDDPGGENEIIIFKSCFPNSDLEGNPDDAASPEGWLSVSNAKYTYNELLKYFVTRPDKLFVVVTAPPLSQKSHSANARAFNNWLVYDWLSENNYPLHNVAVFDFYNLLTGPENHHRVANGKIEHVTVSGRNTLYYPSGDDHPSREGNQKATNEFVPLLNVFYHRWKEMDQGEQPVQTGVPSEVIETGLAPDEPGTTGGDAEAFYEGFENSELFWTGYDDGGGTSRIDCSLTNEVSFDGNQSLKVDYSIAKDGWGTCALFFEEAQNWSSNEGLTFTLLSNLSGQTIDVDLYSGSTENQATYLFSIQDTGSSSEWRKITIPWAEFTRVAWEENAGESLSASDKIAGLAFGIPSNSEKVSSGVFWIDSIGVTTGSSKDYSNEQDPQDAQMTSHPEEESKKPGLLDRIPFCSSAIILPIGLLGWVLVLKKRLL